MRRKPYGDDLYAELERLSVPKVLHMQSLNQFHVLDRDRVSAWLKVKEAEAAEESLSISRKALRSSKCATIIAISAIILSIITAIPAIPSIIQFIQWLLNKISP